MTALWPAEKRDAARARLALRAEARDASELVAALPAEAASTPGVVFERAAYMRRKRLDSLALAQAPNFPHEVSTPAQADRISDQPRHLILPSLKRASPQPP